MASNWLEMVFDLLNEFLNEGWEKRVHARPELQEEHKENLEKQQLKLDRYVSLL